MHNRFEHSRVDLNLRTEASFFLHMICFKERVEEGQKGKKVEKSKRRRRNEGME